MPPTRVLLVAEGATEYGREVPDEEGAIPPLVRAILGSLGPDSLAFERQRLMSLPKQPGCLTGVRRELKGLAGRAFSAVVLSRDREALVFVHDSDGDRAERYAAIREGIRRAVDRHPDLAARAIAVGVPKETIEAWLLADAGAFRRALQGDPPDLPSAPESLWGKSDEPQGAHPKQVLRRILMSLGIADEAKTLAAARQRLARELEPRAVASKCPESFLPFHDDVLAQLSPLLRKA